MLPKFTCYIIQAKGGKGGDSSTVKGGYGASVRARACLTAGQVLTIVVGQAGQHASASGFGGGGGGGSFVYDVTKSTPVLYVAAGGGGGCEQRMRSHFNNSGQAKESGQNAYDAKTGGKNGHGGRHAGYGGAGAGWFSSGQAGSFSGPGHSRTQSEILMSFK